MHKKYSKFLIVSFIGVFILGVYSYFYNDLSSEASTDSSLVSSLDGTNTTASGDASSDIGEDVAFLLKLGSLNSINIDTSLFSSSSFNSLVDNNVRLDPVPYGRVNPFSPMDKNASNVKSSVILKTNGASLITTSGAVLNGSLEGATSSNVYFEYGTTPSLGKTTSKVIPSLIGNLVSTLSLLESNTTYYFRSVANINGTLTFGEIISFKTK